MDNAKITALLHTLPSFARPGRRYDLEGAAAEIKKLDDDECVLLYHTMKGALASVEFKNMCGPIIPDIRDVMVLVKEQALRGGSFSPFDDLPALKTQPYLNILVVMGRYLADLFVFKDEPTLDALRTEYAKHSDNDRLRAVTNITSNPMTQRIVPRPVLDEILAVITPE